jgi:hypothetical protein
VKPLSRIVTRWHRHERPSHWHICRWLTFLEWLTGSNPPPLPASSVSSNARFRCPVDGPDELDVLFESIIDDQFGHDLNSGQSLSGRLTLKIAGDGIVKIFYLFHMAAEIGESMLVS